MGHRGLTRAIAGSLALLALAGAPAASAQVEPYRTNDPGGFRNILPPGANGLANAAQIGSFLAACPPGSQGNCENAPRPPHSNDELSMYGNLVYASPGLKPEDIDKFYKDASFGVRDGEAERTYSPREDVTVLRDKNFGIPHVYGKTRQGAMFGLGYVGAEDRLFLMDALRNAGRGQLSSFAGGAEGNRTMDRDVWKIAPYAEADLQRQFDLGDEVYGETGRQRQEDVTSYVAGINKYIAEARLDLTKMPGEYAAIGRPTGPEDWKVTDTIATASLIGGIFGKGGGGELDSALLLQEVQKRFGPAVGRKVWRDLRSSDDPEAPVTVHEKRFPYQTAPKRLVKGGEVLPDPGSVKKHSIVASSQASAESAAAPASPVRGLAEGLRSFPRQGSNALLVSARESQSGHPLAVMGPQTAYFTPQLLMDVDVHAPGIDARGATFAGISLYVLLGRGRDYAWSATSAGQDIIDTFAVELCEPGGGRPSVDSKHYLFRGQCTAMETLERRNSWIPNPGDPTPAGNETLVAERTKLGLVDGRGTAGGKPVAFTKLRATYGHEADSSLGFVELNDPNKIRSARDFQNAVSKIGFTFNWFYADSKDIAYFNSGNNPVRARGTSQDLPVSGSLEWRDLNTDIYTARYTPFAQHPQAINQSYFTSWNNKQARGFHAADDNFAYGSVYRSEPLDDRIIVGTRRARKMSLVQLIDAMEGAGTVDLRADKVLAFALRILGRQTDPELVNAIETLKAWRRAGNRRIDSDGDGKYENAAAIRILDAWFPLWLEAQLKPTLGNDAFKKLESMRDPDDEPNVHGSHLGSAYNGGWYHYVEKDLRTVLSRIPRKGKARQRALAAGVRPFARRSAGRDVKGLGPNAFVPKPNRYSRVYCGGNEKVNGSLRRCRQVLADSLKKAIAESRKPELYKDTGICEDNGMQFDQWCFDAVQQRPVGAVTQPLIHWINRPTFQQVLEIPAQAPRP